MRKIFSLTIALVAAFFANTSDYSSANAQNVQLHYDLGHSVDDELSARPSVTTTVEMFRPDKFGSTFFFVDIDYFTDGVAGAYWEVAREFNISRKLPFAVHVEYNGGMASSQINDMSTRFQHAALVGGAWNWHSADFSKTLSLQAMYKHYFKGQHAWNEQFSSFQLTAVWGMQFCNRMFTFSGFADTWYDPNVNGKMVFLAEPQLWFNVYSLPSCEDIKLSVGTEVELSNNFVWTKSGQNNRFFAVPTIAAKWTF
ncbi:MAG: DUF5020 family protein [Prevotella sp.]|nr:DUF5020 family protein [Prevotella sp.]